MKKIKEMLAQNPTLIPAVVCFPIRRNEVLLIHRIKTSDGLGQDLISGIGGKVGDKKEFSGESPEKALIRECGEEISIIPINFRKAGRVRFLWASKPSWNMSVTVYIVEGWEGSPTETNVARPVWHKINNLPKESMWEDNLYWVPKVLAGKNIDAIFLYGENKKLAEHIFN